MSAVRRTAGGKPGKASTAGRAKPKPGSKKGEPKRIPAVTSVLDVLRGPTVNDPEIVFAWRRMIAMFIFVAVLLGAHVWVRLMAQDLGYEKQYVDRIIQRLEREYLELETAVNHEASATVLAERAEELGLRMPELGQIQQFQFVAAPVAANSPVSDSNDTGSDPGPGGAALVALAPTGKVTSASISSQQIEAGEVVANAQP